MDHPRASPGWTELGSRVPSTHTFAWGGPRARSARGPLFSGPQPIAGAALAPEIYDPAIPAGYKRFGARGPAQGSFAVAGSWGSSGDVQNQLPGRVLPVVTGSICGSRFTLKRDRDRDGTTTSPE